MWLIAALPLALLNPGLCLLMAAGQPTRKRAAVIGGLLAILCFLYFGPQVNARLMGSSLTAWDLMNPARPAILHYLMPAASPVPIDFSLVFLTLTFGVLELLLVGAAIWLWMQWREQSA
jgi:hypothetical protein